MILLLALTTPALADGPQLSADPFRPQVGQDTLLVQDAAKAPELAAGAWLHHVHAPLVYVTSAGTTEIVRGATALNVAAAWGVGRTRFQLGAPIYLASSGDLDDGRGTALGDLGLDARVWLGGGERGDVAATGRVSAGLGGSRAQLGEPGVGWEIGLAGAADVGPVRVLANAAYRGTRGVELENVDLDDAVRWGAAACVGRAAGGSVEVFGNATLGALSNPAGRPTELMATGWLTTGPGRARLGVSTGVSPGIGSPRWRVVGGYEGVWGPIPE